MATGDSCTCSGPWVAIEHPTSPPQWMQHRAVQILNEGHPDGYELAEEGPDGNCYRYLREMHPPEPSIPHWHPGVSVTVCSAKKAGPPQVEGEGSGGSGSSGQPPSSAFSSAPPPPPPDSDEDTPCD